LSGCASEATQPTTGTKDEKVASQSQHVAVACKRLRRRRHSQKNPPSLGPLTVNALVAADRVIVPVQTEYFALEGLADLLDTLKLIQRELNPRLTIAGMLLTMHDGRTRLSQDVEREIREHFPSSSSRP